MDNYKIFTHSQYFITSQIRRTMAQEMGPTVVIDNGTSTCRAGFAGEGISRTSFPNVLGRSRFVGLMLGMTPQYYIGEEAEARSNILRLFHPVEHGIVTNWDNMAHIWNYVFSNELSVAPSEHSVLLTEAPFNPKANREKTTAIMFETFEVPRLCLANQAVLSLYASGRTSGIVLESGAGATHTVPISQGIPIHSSTLRSYLAGNELTQHLGDLVRSQLQIELGHSEMGSIRDMKEKLCYVAFDLQAEIEASRQAKKCRKVYELPDKQTITLNSQRFRCPEVLFRPHLLNQQNLQAIGIHEMIQRSILNSEIGIRKELYGNIVLSGGNTMLRGMAQRLKAEMVTMAPPNMAIQVVAPARRQLSAWIGGGIVAGLKEVSNRWVTRAQYQQYGPQIVHKRCW